jgi:phosphoribulokinase
MSGKHPIVGITGASGAGTTVVKHSFSNIFLREGITAAFVDGESFRRYDRTEMQTILKQAESEGKVLSPYGPDVNRFDQLEELFKTYSESGTGILRRYISKEAAEWSDEEEGTFAEPESLPENSDLLFYEGLHGGVVASRWTRREMSESHNPVVIKERRNFNKNIGVDVAQYVDLLIGIVPVINLEWIQKIHKDVELTGHDFDEVARKVVARMKDYIHFIVPQFSVTDINFQRVPIVDTSNPFIAKDIPAANECVIVVRFREPKKYDFPYLLRMIDGAMMSRPNTIVIPGGELQQAIDVICTPLIHSLIEKRKMH